MIALEVVWHRSSVQGVRAAVCLFDVCPSVVVVIVVDRVRGCVTRAAIEGGCPKGVGHAVAVGVQAYAWVQWIHVHIVRRSVVVVIEVVLCYPGWHWDVDVVDPDGVLSAID